MTNEYSLKIKSYGKMISEDSYASLWDVCVEMSKKLNNMNAISELDKGEYAITTYEHEEFSKRYVIDFKPLNLEMTIHKKSTGNINREMLERYLKEIKILYERNNY